MIDTFLYYPLILLARLRVKKIRGMENIPKNSPILIVSNHIDYLDGWLLGLLLLAKLKRRNYFITKTKNYFWTRGITIPLDKYGPEGSLEKAHDFLKEGRVLILFPEGERNVKKELLKGKTGAARLALWTKCPVIPVGIIGFSASSFWASVFQAIFYSRAVTIIFGPPVDLTSYYDKEMDHNLLAACTKKIMEEIGKLAQKTYPY